MNEHVYIDADLGLKITYDTPEQREVIEHTLNQLRLDMAFGGPAYNRLLEQKTEIEKERQKLQRELDATVEHHSVWVDAIDKALGQPRDLVEGDLLANLVGQIKRLRLQAAIGESAE